MGINLGEKRQGCPRQRNKCMQNAANLETVLFWVLQAEPPGVTSWSFRVEAKHELWAGYVHEGRQTPRWGVCSKIGTWHFWQILIKGLKLSVPLVRIFEKLCGKRIGLKTGSIIMGNHWVISRSNPAFQFNSFPFSCLSILLTLRSQGFCWKKPFFSKERRFVKNFVDFQFRPLKPYTRGSSETAYRIDLTLNKINTTFV